MKYDVIVVGSGLAGLTSSYYLQKSGKKVLLLEKEKFIGGRTSSWNDNGMDIEAGFHRHIGYYKALPKLLKEVNVKLNDIVIWEKQIEIIIDKDNSIILGIDPIRHPIYFLKGIFGNRKILSFKDKISLLKLFFFGFINYIFRPGYLDNYSILDYAKKLKITDNIINYIIVSLSTGIFFLPSNKYSSKLFFGLFYPGIFRLFKIRIGAYKDGMSDVITNPIKKAFEKLGGTYKENIIVKDILIENNKVIGIKIKDNIYKSNNVVLATDIYNAQNILKTVNNNNFDNILSIPTTSAITIQIELKKRIMKYDRATFMPNTNIASFTEESHTTFKESKGRLSIILANPDKFLNINDEQIYNIVVSDLKNVGINIKNLVIDYRIIRHENKFYNFSFGNDLKRPSNKTYIKGLYLAGDYTRNKFYATMEGAVLSGINVYKIIIKEKN